jgi:hypothetical protein
MKTCSQPAALVELEATSADRSVLDAVAHALAHAHLIRDYIPCATTSAESPATSTPALRRTCRVRGSPLIRAAVAAGVNVQIAATLPAVACPSGA